MLCDNIIRPVIGASRASSFRLVRPTSVHVQPSARAPQRKLIALRATVPSSGTGPSTRSYPVRVARVGAVVLLSLPYVQLGTCRATTSRRSRCALNCPPRGTVRVLLFHSLCSVADSLRGTLVHTHARAHTGLYTRRTRTLRVHTVAPTRRARARAHQRSFSLSLSLQPSLNGRVPFLSNTVSSFATSPTYHRFLPPLSLSLSLSLLLF